MPVQTIKGTEVRYYLIALDENGKERREADGSLTSETISEHLKDTSIALSDVFVMSHGWMADVPGAIAQYDAWVPLLAAANPDPKRVPLYIGLHWPSLPWGDETMSTGAGVLGGAAPPIESEVDDYALRIGDTPAARDAIRMIFTEAEVNPNSVSLTPELRAAYRQLFKESGLGLEGPSGAPGADQNAFDPDAIVWQASKQVNGGASGGVPGLLGFGNVVKNIVLAPLRTLSFWKMKDRARQIGEGAAHDLLRSWMLDAPKVRFHLMGHSFGCIVVSASLAGAAKGKPLSRPASTLYLVQGALSLWSYADDIPYVSGTGGYFRRILDEQRVSGPVVTTRSRFDSAVGFFYPLGACAVGEIILAAEDYPPYGGIGAFGIRGIGGAEDRPMLPASSSYSFQPGQVYNLEASEFIKKGEGPSGAHCDIVHPEVAHAFWQAALVTRISSGAPSPLSGTGGGGLLGIDAATAESRGVSVSETWTGPNIFGGPGEVSEEPSKPLQTDERRWVNAEIENHPIGRALTKGVPYTLVFDVDAVLRESATGGTPVDNRWLAPGEPCATLTVLLGSPDFSIVTRSDSLVLPREGKSTVNASFTVTPLHDGPSAIKATILREGNFLHEMDLKFDIGAPGLSTVEVTNIGRPTSAAEVVKPRDVLLVMTPEGDGYSCTLVGGNKAMEASLTLPHEQLAKAVDVARGAMMQVVKRRDANGQFVFQNKIDIPTNEQRFALKTMACAGAKLFDDLFYYPGSRADINSVGDYLRNIALGAPKLKLQFAADRAPLPWAMLYLGDVSQDSALDWSNFLGMRHIVEMIPIQNNSTEYYPAEIPSQPSLVVSVNVNNDIDQQSPGLDLVMNQTNFWRSAAQQRGIHYVLRTCTTEVVKALASADADDQIMYFYCHAKSADLNAPNGPDAACLMLTDGSIVQLGDLKLYAPAKRSRLKSAPLVFINACESAEMSPSFYDGFVPYFIDKNARGVVGTECQTPALFAAEWAKRFFEHFLNGEPLGDAFLDLRKEFIQKHGNPLGLLYAVHSDGDARVDPPLRLAASPAQTARQLA